MGNKSILISIQPKWVAKMLNGEKTIEVRKRFPKAYVGWVYIYCTKERPPLNLWTSKTPEKCSKAILNINEMQEDTEVDNFMNVEFVEKYPQYEGETIYFHPTNLNGKVVARFWCDKVEEIEHYPYEAPEHPRGYQIAYDTQTTNWDKLCEMSCLSRDELFDYLGRNNGYAIHISKLEIFDKPREINEFGITKAPQSWCYIEV